VNPDTGTSHRVTARAAVPVVLAFLLLNLLWLSGNAWFLLLAGGSVGVLVVGLLSRARVDGLTVSLTHEPRVTVGDELSCVLTVANRGARASSETTLCLQTLGLADLTAHIATLAPGESASVPIGRAATRRAVSGGTVGQLLSRPSLGLVSATRPLRILDHVTVHPRLSDVPATSLAWPTVDGAGGSVVAGSAAEVLGVREWRAGDDRRRVHWRSTARTGRLTLLERGDIGSARLRLVLVGSDRSPGFEEALGVAASWCDVALRTGCPVTAVVWHTSGPVLAPTQSRWSLLDWWSSVQDTTLPDPAVFGSAVLAGFGAGEVLVAGPAEVDDGWLAEAHRACPGVGLRRLEALR
jgi:uncharacterized protein (DUF58 family)